jgi:hypothetical protein
MIKRSLCQSIKIYRRNGCRWWIWGLLFSERGPGTTLERLANPGGWQEEIPLRLIDIYTKHK